MSPESALERARQHVFSSGTRDAGESLCVANMTYGLAKIQEVQAQLGLPRDATFVGAPDATVTRNRPRWRQGFGYGGRIQWTGDFAVLDEKPNACGMLVGALPRLPTAAEADDAARRVASGVVELEGTRLDYDLHESNHFVDLLEVRGDAAGLPSRFLFIMHSSGHEHRGPTHRGPGLYVDESEELRRAAEVRQTPWGTLSILRGDVAHEWFAFVERVQQFNLARRVAFARALFGSFTVVKNATHQGLRALGDVNIGCYVFDRSETEDGTLYPLTLSPTLPAYLVAPLPNLTEAIVEQLGWAERASRLGVLGRLVGLDVLPHGGGYTYPQFRGVARVHELGADRRAFELEAADGGSPTVTEDVRALRYGYRGMEILDRTVELALARPVHTLDIRHVLSLGEASSGA